MNTAVALLSCFGQAKASRQLQNGHTMWSQTQEPKNNFRLFYRCVVCRGAAGHRTTHESELCIWHAWILLAVPVAVRIALPSGVRALSCASLPPVFMLHL